MPLTAQQKAEKRARAALEQGRPYEARTAANQAVVAQIQEEGPERRGEKRALALTDNEVSPPSHASVVKRSKKGAFASREAWNYKNRLAVARREPSDDPIMVRTEQAEVQRHLVSLAAVHCPGEYEECPLRFGCFVLRYYSENVYTQFRLRDKEMLEEYAQAAAEAALGRFEDLRRERRENLRRQAEEERQHAAMFTAQHCAVMTLHEANGKCEDCRLARKRHGPRRCEIHEAMYQGLLVHYLTSAQTEK